MSTEGGIKAVIAALIANLGIATAKFVAFLITGSSSMLSEAIHSVADSGNQVLLLVGNKRSRRARTVTHQFGYGRVRYIYGFMVAIVLFLIGGLFSLYEGIHKIEHPEPLSDATVAFIVLIVAIGLEGFSLRTALKESNKSRGRRNLFRFVRETRNPELPVILLEDTGALLGLVFALVGVTLAVVTGNGAWDGLGAAAVGTLLVVIAIFLGVEMTSMLTGESALPEEDAAIRTAIEGTTGVESVIHMRTLHVGPDEILVAVKIAVSETMPAGELAALINRTEASIRAQLAGKTAVVYIEPDIYDPAMAAAAAAEVPAGGVITGAPTDVPHDPGSRSRNAPGSGSGPGLAAGYGGADAAVVEVTVPTDVPPVQAHPDRPVAEPVERPPSAEPRAEPPPS